MSMYTAMPSTPPNGVGICALSASCMASCVTPGAPANSVSCFSGTPPPGRLSSSRQKVITRPQGRRSSSRLRALRGRSAARVGAHRRLAQPAGLRHQQQRRRAPGRPRALRPGLRQSSHPDRRPSRIPPWRGAGERTAAAAASAGACRSGGTWSWPPTSRRARGFGSIPPAAARGDGLAPSRFRRSPVWVPLWSSGLV